MKIRGNHWTYLFFSCTQGLNVYRERNFLQHTSKTHFKDNFSTSYLQLNSFTNVKKNESGFSGLEVNYTVSSHIKAPLRLHGLVKTQEEISNNNFMLFSKLGIRSLLYCSKLGC